MGVYQWSVVLYPKDTEKWKQFTTFPFRYLFTKMLFCIPKILKNESNSQQVLSDFTSFMSCFVSQRYWKMKAIHNSPARTSFAILLFCIPKILKNESNSQQWGKHCHNELCCFVSQRYWKMKAIHNRRSRLFLFSLLFCIPKILKNESNSQRKKRVENSLCGCFVSQRYWKMKAIHNLKVLCSFIYFVVLYPKDTEKWKQFTT